MQKTKRILWIAAALAAVLAVAVAGCKQDDEDDWTPVTIRNAVLEKYAGERTTVTIPDGVTGIGSKAFSGTAVTAVVIPSGVRSIAPDAFDDSKVTSISFIGSQKEWNELAGGELAESLRDAGRTVSCFIIDKNGILTGYEGDEADVVIPAGFVKGIAAGVFSGRGITGVTIPGSVRRVGAEAFADCTALAEVQIEAGVAKVGAGAFAGCTGLTAMVIPAGVTELGGGIFTGCTYLTELRIHESVTTIASGALTGTEQLERIDYSGKKALWERLVADNGIGQDFAGKTVTCVDGVWSPGQGTTTPGDGTGDEGDGKDPDEGNDDPAHTHTWGEYTYGNNAHSRTCTAEDCGHSETQAHSLGECESDGAGGHQKSCTAGCGYSETVDHDWRKEYATDADTHYKPCTIDGCTARKEEGAHAYDGSPYKDDGNGGHYQECTVCKHQSDSEEHEYDDDTDAKCDKCGNERVLKPSSGSLPIEGGTLTIDENGRVTKYTTDYSTPLVDIPADVTGIGDYAFHGNEYIQSVMIPNTVTSIGTAAFAGCGSLAAMDIPNGVTSIGNGAFQGCNSLSTVTIPNTVTSIGDSAFYGCGNLSRVDIPYGVTSIGKETFYQCSSLSTVTIPNSVTSIGEEAFFWCNSLSNVTIPSSVTEIGKNAFYGNSSLLSIVIPGSVATIGEGAFNNSGIQHVTISKDVKSIGSGAFANCPTFMTITFNGTRAQWEALTSANDIGIVDTMNVTCSDDIMTP